jgi:hypothetical protein
MSWNDTFASWARPPGETEQTKCENALTAIRKAIRASSALDSKNIKVFAQGSYCNRTNVRQNSDVDVCIMCADSFFFDLPSGKAVSDFDIVTPAPYSFPSYKADVEAALRDYFGSDHVTRGNKAFDIHENTYRIDADAVATFEYHRYADDGSYIEGVSFLPDNGARVINWPEQNYENGVNKNKASSGRFKDVVRILKRLQIQMEENKVEEAKSIPSFLIECLVWNAPYQAFGHDTLQGDVREVLAHLFNDTRTFDSCKEWGEINELKYLFRTSQPWALQKVHSFISAAWDYLGFE